MNLLSIFEQKRELFQKNPYPLITTRRDNLQQLKRLLQEHAYDLARVISDDFSHRAQEETLFLEVAPAIKAIEYCMANLRKWSKSRKRHIPWYLTPSKASLIAQPLGVVGIIAPWNYPIYLSIVPLVYALAAGNPVMVKMSELTPATGLLLEKLINQNPALKAVITIINSDVDLAKEFSALPFGHLLFTGSSGIGKQVMAAASRNLTPVTLELGGKSPALVSSSVETVYLDRLFMGKLFNGGQTCVAPDYLLLPKGMENQLENLFGKFLEKHYSNLMNNDNYTSIISTHHKERLQGLLAEAKSRGARVVEYGQDQENSRKMPVYLLFDVKPDMAIMNEEIFGPLLPVSSYETFQDALNVILEKPNPLALYYFGKDAGEIRLLQRNTLSGALVINDTIMHLAADDLPFGGVGHSGMGHYHGQEGFDTFSKLKPIFIQRRFAPVTWLYPPYGRLLNLFLRYIAGIRSGKQ